MSYNCFVQIEIAVKTVIKVVREMRKVGILIQNPPQTLQIHWNSWMN